MKVKRIATQFSNNGEVVFANGMNGFVNIMVRNERGTHDGVAKDMVGVELIAKRIADDQNRENFIAWAKEVV